MLRKGAPGSGRRAPAHAVVVSHFLAPIFVLPQARPLPAPLARVGSFGCARLSTISPPFGSADSMKNQIRQMISRPALQPIWSQLLKSYATPA